MTPTKYILTGAGGHLGMAILKELCRKDAAVYALLFQGDVPVVFDHKIKYFHGDVRDTSSLVPLFEDNYKYHNVVVIHTAALISIAYRKDALVHDVNVGGTSNVIDLCEIYGISRLVHVSSVHAIPELPIGQTMTEPQSFSPESVVGGYAKTKAEGAQVVLNAVNRGLDAVLVFPSGIIGPYDVGRNHLVQVAVEYIKGLLPACVKGGYDLVDVRDVAKGCILAAERGKKGESYILSGQYVSIHEFLSITGKFCGKKPVPALPRFLVKIGLPFVWLHSKVWKRRPLYTRYSLYALASNGLFSNAKATKALGYKPRSIHKTIKDMVSWLKHRGVY